MTDLQAVASDAAGNIWKGALALTTAATTQTSDPDPLPDPVGNSDAYVNVASIGYDTASIAKAFASTYNGSVAKSLLFPAGTYQYNGPGFAGPNPAGYGDIFIKGVGGATVLLGSGSYLVRRDSAPMGNLQWEDLNTQGGLGAIRLGHSAANTNNRFRVNGSWFYGYSKAAISWEAQDMPNWHIWDNIFDGANSTSTIGIAVGGYPDNVVIEGNEFRRFRVGIKSRTAGDNIRIDKNAFVLWEGYPGVPRIPIWICPADPLGWTTFGSGAIIQRCKFGNENRTINDFIIVVADEGAGNDVQDRWPILDQPSSGKLLGHYIGPNEYCGPTPAILFSTTPTLLDVSIEGDVFGTLPNQAVKILNDMPATGLILGPWKTQGRPFPMGAAGVLRA